MQDFTIKEFENSMTLYYFKSSGKIHSWCTGINDMSSFGEHEEDYSLMLDFLVIPIDRYVLDNLRYFSIIKVEEEGETKRKLCFDSPSTNYISR